MHSKYDAEGGDPRLIQSVRDIRELGYRPSKLFKPEGNVDLTQTPIDQVTLVENRPYLIIGCDQPNSAVLPKEAVYKTRIAADPRYSASNERVFLSQFLPLLREAFPAGLENQVVLPAVLKARKARAKGLRPFILEEYLKGQLTGGINWVGDGMLGIRDMNTIAGFAHTINSFTPEELTRRSIDFRNLDKGFNAGAFGVYTKAREKRESRLRSILTAPVFDNIYSDLNHMQDWLESRPEVLVAGDINPSNIIKQADGKLGLIDFERVGLGNAGADHSWTITWLYRDPILRKAYMKAVTALNSDNPDTLERTRIDFIYWRATGELLTWSDLLEKAKTEAEHARCSEAVNLLKDHVLEAIDRGGIWKTV